MRKEVFPADAGYRFQRFVGPRKEPRTRQAFLHRDKIMCDEWEVVVPELVFEPAYQGE